jgi:hypothetical protein
MRMRMESRMISRWLDAIFEVWLEKSDAPLASLYSTDSLPQMDVACR